MADITWGTKIEVGVPDSRTLFIQCCQIASDKFVVVWQDGSDGHAGKARVATVSGTTITWGAVSEFYSYVEFGLQLGVCKLDTDKFAVVYRGLNSNGWARVGTVSTRTISWGAEKEFETGDTTYPSCCQLGVDKFAIAYYDAGPNTGNVCVATVSGDTITSGTPVGFEGSDTSYFRCAKLDTDKFLAFYRDFSAKACAFSVSGTTPTAGTILEIDASTSEHQDCIQLATDKCLLLWNDASGNTNGGSIIVTRDDTPSTDTLHEGTEVEFNPDNAVDIGAAKIDDAHFVIVYRDRGNSNKGTSRYCSFSGTTITLDGEEIYLATRSDYNDICLISANKVAVVYQDEADANRIGEARVGDLPPPISAPTVTTQAVTNIGID